MNLIRPLPPAKVELAVLSLWYRLAPPLRERLVLLGTFAGLTLLLLLWALLFRKRRPDLSSHKLSYSQGSSRRRSGEASTPGDRPRKSRRRRHERLPRNPTLAETRGLPPLRTQEPPETAF